MAQHTLFYRFGVALFIGILVGLQREHASETIVDRQQDMFAGVRTFALMGVAGCTAAMIADLLVSPWIFLGIFLLLGLMVGAAYVVTAMRSGAGMTTEMAAILTILAGALCYWDELALAVALGVVVTGLLSLKLELHRLAERITQDDIVATLKFAVITAIVLPILPNQAYGPPPFDVLNPYKIWLMVVLISGISFLGYVLFKLVGTRRGIGLTGLLGGLASSTATTLSFAQRSRSEAQLAKPFALAIMLAWTVMFGRILVTVGALSMPLLRVVWLPLVITAVAALIYVAYLYFGPRAEAEEDMQVSNPFELKPAITFGLIYGVVLLISRAASYYLGSTGVYISSVVSGLADVDAVALSVTELSRTGDLSLTIAARAIVLAAAANTFAKGGIVLVSGSESLRRALLPGFVLILGTAVAVVLLL